MNNKSFNEIKIGNRVSFLRHLTEDDMSNFVHLSGDNGPLHTDQAFAMGTKFQGKIIHGLLLATFFSRLIGVELPGNYSCLAMEFRFKSPARIGDQVEVSGVVVSKSLSTGIVEIEVQIKKDEQILVEGRVHAQVL